mmetsp:Transcript_13036/g.36571  ORF Transcript_13036/g.36571 Transcript_13036/m.36571 type:complete len:240 (+) Transcript_13036:1102-1821(+)
MYTWGVSLYRASPPTSVDVRDWSKRVSLGYMDGFSREVVLSSTTSSLEGRITPNFSLALSLMYRDQNVSSSSSSSPSTENSSLPSDNTSRSCATAGRSVYSTTDAFGLAAITALIAHHSTFTQKQVNHDAGRQDIIYQSSIHPSTCSSSRTEEKSKARGRERERRKEGEVEGGHVRSVPSSFVMFATLSYPLPSSTIVCHGVKESHSIPLHSRCPCQVKRLGTKSSRRRRQKQTSRHPP